MYLTTLVKGFICGLQLNCRRFVMGSYSPLNAFLAAQRSELVPMSFKEIEAIIGRTLPASKQYPAWWSNNPSNNPMTREWLNAGFQTESVNIASEKLVFRRVKKSGPLPPQAGASSSDSRLPFFGFMKGKMTIEPGYDITKPIDVDWEEPYLGDGRVK
jgi:hypothetical protein